MLFPHVLLLTWASIDIFLPKAKRRVQEDMDFQLAFYALFSSLMVYTEVDTNKNSIVWMDN